MNREQCYALILGASSGFGRAAALALAAEGYPIIGVHLDRAATLPAVEELKSKIQSYGVRTLFFNANAADAARRAEIIAALRTEFGERPGSGVYVVLHSLAFGSLRPLVAPSREDAITQSQLEMTLDVMANSLVYWVQDLYAEGMLLRRGRILSLTSAGSHRNLPMYGAVSAAKAALESYTRQLGARTGTDGDHRQCHSSGSDRYASAPEDPGQRAADCQRTHAQSEPSAHHAGGRRCDYYAADASRSAVDQCTRPRCRRWRRCD